MSAARRLAATVLGVSLLAGCSSGPPDIAAATSGELQTAVLSVGTAAAAGDYAAAAAQLDALQSRLDQSRSAGKVGAGRAARIQAAIDQVRADLGALAPTPAPAPAASPTVTDAAPSTVSPNAGPVPGKHKRKGKGSG